MSPEPAPILTIERLSKRYRPGEAPAVAGLDLAVRPGEFFTLLGPSGCGKSTTLRMIAGLERPDDGRIVLDGAVLSDGSAFVPPHRRDIAMVFQSYAIWPHMTVLDNVLFPLDSLAQHPPAERRRRALEAIEQVSLSALANRSATLLSGGQQQRVALARAIVREARLILLDEPLSNLDAALREQMRGELLELQKRLGTTAIYVTHDQDEALQLSDRIALMRDGLLVDLGTPTELYLTPRTAFTAGFTGRTRFHPAKVIDGGDQPARVETGFGTVHVAARGLESGVALLLMIRPEHVELSPGHPSGISANRFGGIVRTARFAGRTISYEVDVAGELVEAMATTARLFAVGDAVTLFMPPERCRLLPPEVSP